MRKGTMVVAALLTLGSVLFGQAPANIGVSEIKVAASQPGDYNIIMADGQMTMQTYEVVGMDPKIRVNLVKGFNKLLAHDGRGGRVEVSQVTRDKKEIILLTVTATKTMQTSIGQTIERINSGQFGNFDYLTRTEVFLPQYRSAESIAAALRPEITSIGILHVDSVLNALTIEDDPTFVEFLLGIAKQYDVPPPRIEAEVRIVEILDGRDRNIGVDWQALLDTLPVSVNVGISGERPVLTRSRSVTIPDKIALESSDDHAESLKVNSFSVAVERISPQALAGFINLLEARGLCRLVHQVKVNVVNAAPTTVSTTVDTPVTATLTDRGGGKIRGELQTLEGVEISISGSLAREGRRLEIKASSTSVVSYGRTGLPIIARSELETTIVITDGKIALLSGLAREKEVEVVYRSPLLGDLDILGIFSKKVKERKRWNVYVLITTSPPGVHEGEWSSATRPAERPD